MVGDDLLELETAIARTIPGAALQTVAEEAVSANRIEHPAVPEHYLELPRRVGYGALGHAFALYSGRCAPHDFFDADTAASLAGVLFFGDDMAGWMAGFDTRAGWALVGVDSSWPAAEPLPDGTAAGLIARQVLGRS